MNGNHVLPFFNTNDFWEKLQTIPDNFGRIFSNAIAFLIMICFAIGIVLVVVGAIKWATGWDDRSGKKTIVKGIVLIAISLVGGGIGIGVSPYI
ncbi:MAG: hypothetical protein FK734_06230 [Asgard group archaeon]|nr:hypothetical protein [Asgard group archaeon]